MHADKRIQIRHMYQRTVNLLKNHSFFLFGARGTGKTQLLKKHFQDTPNILWIDLLKEGEVLLFIKNPNELSSRIEGLGITPEFVVIDEIQRIPGLLNEVHSLIEEKKIKFALTSSSARKLKRGSGNLLAGRALLYNLFPLTCEELAYLRTHNDSEIDLIAERRGGITWAIEIKSAEEIDIVDIRKLKQLAKDVPNSKAIFLCDSRVAKEVEGVQILPWRQGIELIFKK